MNLQTILSSNGNIALAIAVMVVGAIVRLLKDDTKFPIDIPARWQPVVTVFVGQAYAVLQAIMGGVDWKVAVSAGLKVSFAAMGLFDLVVKAVLNGHDAPWWLGWLLKSSDAKTGQGS